MIPNVGRWRARFPTLGMALGCASLWLALAAAAQAADPGRGGQIYASHCAVCHGERGTPVWPGTPDFRRAATLMKPDAQVLSIMRRGKGVMPGYYGVLKERELMDVLAYLRTLG